MHKSCLKFLIILLLSILVLGRCSQFAYASSKYVLVSYKPLSKAQCQKYKTKLGIKKCSINEDYLAGAAYACRHMKNIPSGVELHQLAKKIYHNNTWETSIYGTRDNALLKKMGIFFDSSHIFYWSSDEAKDGTTGYVRMFASDGSIPYAAPRGAGEFYSKGLGKLSYDDFGTLVTICKKTSGQQVYVPQKRRINNTQKRQNINKQAPKDDVEMLMFYRE